jgi:micrococcal nuclease
MFSLDAHDSYGTRLTLRRYPDIMRRAIPIIIAVLVIAALVWWAAPDELPDLSAPSVVEPVETTVAIDMPADAQPATIDYVHDGDTLFLTDGTKVRLLAVDTPEVGDNLECLGNESRDYLRALLPEGSTVYMLADAQPTDQYGRSLLFIWTATGTLVNLDLVEQGYAEAVFIGGNRLYEAEVEAAEDAAQDAGRGIWGNC